LHPAAWAHGYFTTTVALTASCFVASPFEVAVISHDFAEPRFAVALTLTTSRSVATPVGATGNVVNVPLVTGPVIVEVPDAPFR
jgi:hypothetical protein